MNLLGCNKHVHYSQWLLSSIILHTHLIHNKFLCKLDYAMQEIYNLIMLDSILHTYIWPPRFNTCGKRLPNLKGRWVPYGYSVLCVQLKKTCERLSHYYLLKWVGKQAKKTSSEPAPKMHKSTMALLLAHVAITIAFNLLNKK